MLSREGFLNDAFLRWFPYEPTPCQYALLQKVASFLTSDDGDILVVNGYAGMVAGGHYSFTASAPKEVAGTDTITGWLDSFGFLSGSDVAT